MLLIALGRARPEVEQAHLGILCNASGTSGTSITSGASGEDSSQGGDMLKYALNHCWKMSHIG